MGLIDKIFGGKQEAVSVEEYEELDLSEYEAELTEGETYIRVVEVTSLNDVPEIRRQVYDGNIVIAEITFIKHDKLTLDRIIKDLRQLAEDVGGDIVGLGEDYIIITPLGIKIDRNKIKGIRS